MTRVSWGPARDFGSSSSAVVKCGPWARSIRTSWELVKNTFLNFAPDLTNQRPGGRAHSCVAVISPSDSDVFVSQYFKPRTSI